MTYYFNLCRIIKQAMASSGANVTRNHIEEISLSAFFLMEAAKKAEREFQVTPQSRAHTVRNAEADQSKIVRHLLDSRAVSETSTRTEPLFVDPTTKGWQRMCGVGWIDNILEKSAARESHDDSHSTDQMVDFDYELHDTVVYSHVHGELL